MRWFWKQRIRGPCYLRCFWNGFGNSEFGDHGICDGFGTSEFGDHGICDGFGTSHGSSLRWFWKQRIRGPWYLRCFWKQRIRGPWYLPCVWNQRIRGPWYLRWSWKQRIRGPWYLRCGVFRRPGRPRRTTSALENVDFPATEAPRVRGVLRLYYKSRLSSHGSSGCPRCTTRLYYKKSTFQPRKLRVSLAYYTSVLQKSTFQPRKLSVSAAYYVCTTKSRHKSRFSSHGSPRRATSVLHKSTKTTQKHYGFRTASTRKPAEGLRLHVKKRKNTTVLAPRQRRNPQRGYVCMSQNAKTRRFWHRANAETRRGLSAATEKSTKNDGFSTATRRLPAEVVRGPKET